MSKKQLNKQKPLNNQQELKELAGQGPNPYQQQEQQDPPIINMSPQKKPSPQQQKEEGLVGGLVGKFLKGGTEDQEGLLDEPNIEAGYNHPPMGQPVKQPPFQRQESVNSRMRGNQDLWLLNLFFKCCALVVYFLLPIVFDSALTDIIVLMLTSLDFWIVKNIVGRKLIKMRWWYTIDKLGNERWHYESKDFPVLFQDKLIFWGSLWLAPIAWALLCIKSAITLDILNTSVTLVCALIGLVQLYGYRSCSNAHHRKQKIQNRRKQLAQRRGKGRNDQFHENLLPQQQQYQQQQNQNYRS